VERGERSIQAVEIAEQHRELRVLGSLDEVPVQ
jgi:hypothetical protein